MLKISKQSDYGLLILTYLKKKNRLTPILEVVEKLKLPKRFTARIASLLAKENLLVSKEGKVGGYQLSSKIKELSFYDYLKIFEPRLEITKCSDKNHQCPWDNFCQQKDFFKKKLKKIFIKELKNYKLIKII